MERRPIQVLPIFPRLEVKASAVTLLKNPYLDNQNRIKGGICGRCPNHPKCVARHHVESRLSLWGCERERCRDYLIKVDTAKPIY